MRSFLFAAALLVCTIHVPSARAQWIGNDSGLCPNGRWVPSPIPGGGTGMMCVPKTTADPPAGNHCGGGAYCPEGTQCCGNRCCDAGTYCSRFGCTPQGAVDCGQHYCLAGQKCSRDGRGCFPEHVVAVTVAILEQNAQAVEDVCQTMPSIAGQTVRSIAKRNKNAHATASVV